MSEQEGLGGRWARRKQRVAEEAAREQAEQQALAEQAEEAPEKPLTDADMPPLDSLDESSDYSGFLSPEVSEELRKLALRKLFSSAGFNVTDGLDDYAEDFTSFEPLGDIVTWDMKAQQRREAERAAAEAEARAEVDGDELVDELDDEPFEVQPAEETDESPDEAAAEQIEADATPEPTAEPNQASPGDPAWPST